LKRLIVLVLASALAFGCPYYNTFYNAKRAFSEAERLRKEALEQGVTQVPEQAKRLYDRAIENSALLMRDHPHSDLIDDALVLIGDAFTVQGEYPKAIRKYEEVLANYPDSKWYRYCSFALSRTTLSAGDTLSAEAALRNFLVQYPASEWASDAHMLLGSIDINRQDYNAAIDDLTDFLTTFPDHSRRPEAQYFIAESHLELDRYGEALELFERVGKTARTRALEFQAKFMVGECLRRDQSYEQALETFGDLVRNSSYLTYRPRIMLAIAACQVSMDQIDDALEIYQQIHNRYEQQRNYDAEVSEALFETGRIYERRGDLEQADQYYSNAGRRSPRVFWVGDIADQKQTDIRLLQRYKEELTAAKEAFKSATQDTTHLENREGTEQVVQEIVPKALEKVIETRFKLAEVYLFQFDLVDSALAHYRLAEAEAGDVEMAAKAAYATAWAMDHIMADTSSSRIGYQNVLSEYDSTIYASAAARAISVPDPLGFSERELFARAQDLLFNEEAPDSAVVYYQKILDRYPEGDYASRSLYALGWISETYQNDIDLALKTYRKIKEFFPRSEASDAADLKIKFLEEWSGERGAADDFGVADTGEVEGSTFTLSISPENRHGDVVEVNRDRIVISLREVVPVKKGDTGYLFTMDGVDSTATPVRAALFQVMQATLPEGPRIGVNTANNTNMYANVGDKTIAMITPFKQFEVVAEEGDWIQIHLDGLDGYVHRQFVQLDSLVRPTVIGRIEERFPAWSPDEWLGAVIELDGTTEERADSKAEGSASKFTGGPVVLAIDPKARDGDVVRIDGDQVIIKLLKTQPVSVGDTGYLFAMQSADGAGPKAARFRVHQVRLPDLGLATISGQGELLTAPDGEVLLPLMNGITVVVLAQETGWYRVRVGSNEGYVRQAVVRMMPPALPYNGRIGQSELNLHRFPDGPVVDTLDRDTTVRVLEAQGPWLKVTLNEQEGFVNAGSVSPEPMSDALVFCFIEERLATMTPESVLGAVFDGK